MANTTFENSLWPWKTLCGPVGSRSWRLRSPSRRGSSSSSRRFETLLCRRETLLSLLNFVSNKHTDNKVYIQRFYVREILMNTYGVPQKSGEYPTCCKLAIFACGEDTPGAASTVSSNFLHFHRQPHTPVAFRVSIGKRSKYFCFVDARSGQQLRTSASEKR